MLDIVGMIFGIIGAYILSTGKNYSKKELYIFIFFLISNISFIIYSFYIKSWGIYGQNIAYLFISIKGIIKNLKRGK